MFKKILLIFAGFIFGVTGVLAQTVEEHTTELMNLLKEHRHSIYEQLDLTNEQAIQIEEMDKILYVNLEPEIKKLSVMVKRIEDIANSENCTKKAVYSVQKEFKGVEKDMCAIKKQYIKAFKKVLTPEQKSRYRLVRAQKQAELKSQMRQQMREQNSQMSEKGSR